ncbi:MAG: helix-turn-helix domain-containing protein [Clostridia bacterium]|nr:helix-turn-helix domain-containing protein [Clostridia bacterium]
MTDKELIGRKIRRLREERGLSQEQLANMIGYTSASARSTMSKIESGLRDVRVKQAKLLAAALGVSPVELMTIDKQPDDEPRNALPISDHPAYTVPLVGAIACGSPILAEENIEEMLPELPGVQADMALRCVGDSMIEAGIYDGDIAYIHLQPVVDNNSLVAVRIGDEATLKRYTYDGSKMILTPCNGKYKPLVFQGAQMAEVRVLGRLVGVVRRFK